MNILSLIGRKGSLLDEDIARFDTSLNSIVHEASFLVLGGAGSIGQAVTKEIFKRNPRKLHVVDLSENNLVELVRDIRSSLGYIDGDFKTLPLDIGSVEYDAFIEQDGSYDYVLNLSALKHVRSEKDPFTLMRMISVNILNTDKTIKQSISSGVKKYFCVSTDKAANPVNMMGASKRIMEMFLMRRSADIKISTARFANVAFSDGSLLHGFDQRLKKNQPIVAPKDIKRYFLTPGESGQLCLMSCIFGDNRDIFFPKLTADIHLITFAEIAERYLQLRGFRVHEAENETEARHLIHEIPAKGAWPCVFSVSDTTGEKSFEEFFTSSEELDLERYVSLGVVKSKMLYDESLLAFFEDQVLLFKEAKNWTKDDLVRLFKKILPDFHHKETGKYLDNKM